MYLVILWYGQVDLVNLQMLIMVPLPCWAVLDHFKKRLKCLECH